MIFTQSPGWSSSLPWCCNCCPVISYPDVPRCIHKKRIAKACLAYLPHDLALIFRRVVNRQNQGNSRPQPGAEEVEAKTSPASVSRCKLCIGGGRGLTSECRGTSQANPCHPPIRSGSAFRDHFPGGFTKCYPHFTHPLSRPKISKNHITIPASQPCLPFWPLLCPSLPRGEDSLCARRDQVL